jgi:hypothetical protein
MTVQGISIPKWALVAVLSLAAFASVVWKVATAYSRHMIQTAESHRMLCDIEKKIDSTRVLWSCKITTDEKP